MGKLVLHQRFMEHRRLGYFRQTRGSVPSLPLSPKLLLPLPLRRVLGLNQRALRSPILKHGARPDAVDDVGIAPGVRDRREARQNAVLVTV